MRRTHSSVHFCHCGDHAFAALTKGYMALVSPEDAGALKERCWYAHVGPTKYVTAMSSAGGRYVLSRTVLNARPGDLIDHKNRDSLDCRRGNLRHADPVLNQGNRRPNKGRVLPKGVYKLRDRYVARVTFRGKVYSLGTHATPEEAAQAYAKKARELFGEFARVA